jgi:Protein of unknown function (DUF1800)
MVWCPQAVQCKANLRRIEAVRIFCTGLFAVSLTAFASLALAQDIAPLQVQGAWCGVVNGKVVGFTPQGRGKFTSIDVQVTKLQRSIRRSRSRAVKKKLNRSLTSYKNQKKICANLPPPHAVPLTVSVTEGSSGKVTLDGKDILGRPLLFRIVTPPLAGSVSGAPPVITYQSKKGATFDTLTYCVHNGEKESVPATIAINIVAATPEASASPSPIPEVPKPQGTAVPPSEALAPYNGVVTEEDIRHLCRKVAFGCTQALVDLGIREGLDALITKLLNFEASPFIEELARPFLLNQNQRWTQDGAARYWLMYMIRGNPLKERLALFLHDHFAIDLSPYSDNTIRHRWIANHLALLRNDPLGSFEDLLMSMHSDPAMLTWLDNRFNRYNPQTKTLLPNENYAREVLELFTMGTTDFFSGKANFSEDDMRELTRSLTGFFISQVDGAEIAGFAPDRWDPGAKTLFAGSGFEKRATFDYESVTQHLLYGNRATSLGIAGKLIRVFVTPDPPQAAVEELADQLVKTRYNLGKALQKLMRSNLMFAPTSRKLCISSPVEHIVFVMRALDLPITHVNTINKINDFAKDSGQALLRAPSVFGWMGCGIGSRGQDRAYGQTWNGVQSLLYRQRQLVNLLNTLANNEGVNVFDKFFLNVISADELVRNLAKTLQVPLSPQERQMLVDRLINRRKNPNGTYQTDPFSAVNLPLARPKVAGLIELLSLHPRGMIQ